MNTLNDFLGFFKRKPTQQLLLRDDFTDREMNILLSAFFIVFFWVVLRAIAAPYPHVMGDEVAHGRASRLLFGPHGPLRPEYLYNFIYYFTNYFGDNFYNAAKIFNIFFFSATMPLIYMITRKVCSKSVSLLVTFLVFASPINIYTTVFMADMPYLFFFWLISWFILYCDKKRERYPFLFWGITGVLLGLASFIRERMLFIAPAIVAFIAYSCFTSHSSDGKKHWLLKGFQSTVFSIAFAFLMLLTRESIRWIFIGDSLKKLILLGGAFLFFSLVSLFFFKAEHIRGKFPLVFWSVVGGLLGLAVFVTPRLFFLSPLAFAYIAHLSRTTKNDSEKKFSFDIPRILLNSAAFFIAMLSVRGVLVSFLGEGALSGLLEPGYMSRQIQRGMNWVAVRPATPAGEGLSFYLELILAEFSYYITIFERLYREAHKHIMALAIMYGLPLIIFFSVLLSRSCKRDSNGKDMKKIAVYAFFVFFWLFLASIAYLRGFGSTNRIMMRYYNVVFPFFIIIVSFIYTREFKQTATSRFIAVGITLFMLYVLCNTMFSYRIEQNDCPDLRAIAFNHFTWFSFGIFSVLSAGLFLKKPKLASRVYLLAALPLMGFYSLINPDLYRHGRLPNDMERAAIFVRQNFNATVSSKLVSIGSVFDDQLKAMFQFDTLPAAWGRNPGKIDLTTARPDRWYLVTGDHVVTKDDSWLEWRTPKFTMYGKIKPIHLNFSKSSLSVEFLSRLHGVADVTGVSILDEWEDWGIWSSGGTMRIELLRNLPRNFRMRILARAFGPNIGEPFTIRVGGQRREIRLGRQFMEHYVEFDDIENTNIIDIIIPYPTAPIDLGLSRREAIELEMDRKDVRKLGIALSELDILEDADYLYSPGDLLDFAKNGTASRYSIYGWSLQEDDLRWTDGPRAAMTFKIPESHSADDLLLRMEASAYLGGMLPYQEVGVVVNGRQIATWQVRDWEWYQAFVPSDLLADGMLNLEFVIASPTVPRDVGDPSRDSRALGIAARKFVIYPQRRYPLGEDILTSVIAAEAGFYTKGLSAPEKDGSWTDGKSGTLFIPLKRSPVDDLSLDLSVGRIFGDSQRLRISIKGTLLFDEQIRSGTGSLSVFIPASLLTGDIVELLLEHPEAFSPKSIGESEDSRELAFKWSSIKLRETTDTGTGMPYTLGEKISFGLDGTSSKYTTYGWSHQENTHRWTDGSRSGILLNIMDLEEGKDLQLRMKAAAYLGGGLSHQKVGVIVNDRRIATWQVNLQKWYQAVIPYELLQTGNLKIEFTISDPTSPAEIRESADFRKLGVLVTEMVIDNERSYSLGEKLNFSEEQSPVSMFYRNGLSSPESDGCWTEGKKGSLSIPFEESPKHDMTMEFEVHNIYGNRQRLILSAREEILFDKVIESGTRTIKVFIPASTIEGGRLALNLEYPDAVSPMQVGTGDDPRELAFKWKSIRLITAAGEEEVRKSPAVPE